MYTVIYAQQQQSLSIAVNIYRISEFGVKINIFREKICD